MKKTSTAYILLFAGIFSLCIFSLLFYKRINLLKQAYEMFNQTTQASLQFDKLFLSLRDATVYFHDYLNLHDNNSLNDFNEKIKEYPQILSQLKYLKSGNKVQLEKIRNINVLADNYAGYMRRLVALDKTQPPTKNMLDEGRDMLNNLRVEIDKITSPESKTLVQKNNELNRHIYYTPLFLLIISLTSLVIIIYAFLSIIKQIKETQTLQLNEAKFRTQIHDQKLLTEKLEHLVKERAAELTAKNKDLNEAQRLAHIGSWEWDIKEDKIFWSAELYHIYGVRPDKFVNSYENYSMLTHPDDREHSKKVIEEALQLRKPFDFYHRIQKPDGTISFIHGRGEVYTDENNEPIRMAGTAQDITPIVEIQNRINELNQTFNFAEQTSLIGSFRYNFSSGIFMYSDNLYRILGCKPGEFEPTFENFTRFVHPEDLHYILSQNRELNEENISSEYLFRVIKKDASIIHVRNTGIFITEENQKIYIGTLQDITLQYNKELQLIGQNKALEEMNKELASFSYIASHDLQEPLRKIRMFTRRLSEKEIAVLSEDSKEYFNRIDNAAARMQQLIEDLLSYSSTNTIQTHFALTDMDKLLEDISDSLKEKIVQTGTVIESSDLQSANVIPFQFKQLLTNLITNSMKFTRQNIKPHIRISHNIVNGERTHDIIFLKKIKYHHYIISDNGIGFEPEYNEQVFGLFQRLHGHNEYSGTGIGLAICKKIAENHNGIITASGQVNKGATFDIYIPVEQNASEA